MIHNMTGGGGSQKNFAYIAVTYPSGATVTCSKGSIKLNAENSNGQWVFAVPEAGTWAVTATQGSNSKSQSVSITTKGQLASIEFAFGLYIFNKGTVSGYSFAEKHDNNAGTLTVGSTLSAYCGSYEFLLVHSTQKINLNGYSRMTVVLSRSAGSAEEAKVGICSSLDVEGSDFSASTACHNISGKTTVTVNISSVSSGYFALHVGTNHNQTCTYEIESILFE